MSNVDQVEHCSRELGRNVSPQPYHANDLKQIIFATVRAAPVIRI